MRLAIPLSYFYFLLCSYRLIFLRSHAFAPWAILTQPLLIADQNTVYAEIQVKRGSHQCSIAHQICRSLMICERAILSRGLDPHTRRGTKQSMELVFDRIRSFVRYLLLLLQQHCLLNIKYCTRLGFRV